MKFIRKHTEGKLVCEGHNIFAYSDKYHGRLVGVVYDHGDRQSKFDAMAFSQRNAMLDYMIERAEKLNYWIENKQLIRNGSREELTRIIEILKAAGVEVVE